MRDLRNTAVAAALLAILSAGCVGTRDPSAPPSIALVNLPTFAPGTICNAAMRRGPLTRDAVTGLGVGGMHVRWPWMWTAVLLDGQARLYDEHGHIVAKEGDAMQIGGSGDGDSWFIAATTTSGHTRQSRHERCAFT